MKGKEMEGVKTGGCTESRCRAGMFMWAQRHAETHMRPVALSPGLTSPSQECPSAAAGLEPCNCPSLTRQYVVVFVRARFFFPPRDCVSCLGMKGARGMQRDVDATP